MFCTNCGTKCADGSRFCKKCGSSLTPSVPVSQPVHQPLPKPNTQQIPARKKTGGVIVAVVILLLLLAAVGGGGFFVFQGRAANEAKLEENLALYMREYCLPDIEDYYSDVLPDTFNSNGYSIQQSSFRFQPAKEKNTYDVRGQFDVTDNSNNGVTCRVSVKGTATTDFMRSKCTWDLDYDFEDPPAIHDESVTQPNDSYVGNDNTAGQGVSGDISIEQETFGNTPTESTDYYIWPTDTQYITYDDLSSFSRHEIMLMRNELYARYGCSFQDEEIRNYFLDQSWYTPNPDMLAVNFSILQFTDIERANVNTILNYERDMGWRQ